MRIERIGDATLILGDCLEVMATLDPVDALISDPPYGNSNHDGDWNARLNEHRGIANKPIANDDTDSMRSVMDQMLTLCVPLLGKKVSACCCFCGGGGGPRPVFAWLAERMDREGLQFFHSVVWDKKNPGLGQRYRRQHEMLMVAHRSGSRIRWNETVGTVANIISMMPPRDRAHPNEKPVELMQRIVDVHSLHGDVVLDPFMGSGTTGVACAKLGRKFIGIEIDEGYFEIACRRIEEAYRQPDLFVAPPSNQSEPSPDLFDGDAA